MKLKNALTTYLQTLPQGIPEITIAAGVEQAGVRTFDATNNAILNRATAHQEMTVQRALALTREIDFLAVADHLDVKLDPDWLHLYRIGPGTLPFIAANGARKMRKLNQTVACDACGILLGMDHIQVDHQHPQVGGATMATP
jgi:hypothetical protein